MDNQSVIERQWKRKRKTLLHDVLVRGIECLGHLTGTVFICVLSTAILLDESGRAGVREALQNRAFVDQNIDSLLMQFGLSACVWALIVIGVMYVRESLRADAKLVAVRARGAVLVETLIVMPVMLLLIFGLTQLTLSSTAGLMTSVASFQAGRTVWLWDPETRNGHGRNGGVSVDDVNERARIAAAGVLAPVAPANFSHECQSTSSLFDAKLEAIVSTSGALGTGIDLVSQLIPGMPNFTGGAASVVKVFAGLQRKGTGRNLYLSTAFDSHGLAIRGPLKFYYAYCSTAVTYAESGGYLVTTVSFKHKKVVPMVGRIFGERSGGVFGSEYHSTVQREFRMPAQRNPNPLQPESLDALLNSFSENPFK